MPQLLLRGKLLGDVKGVLFDKDGTLSVSEPELITLAKARVFLCLERVPAELGAELLPLLLRAYGLRQALPESGGSSICPAGITAVASRDHNLIATATALVQVGLGWPEALSLSEEVFALADRIDARRPTGRPSPGASGRPPTRAPARTAESGSAGPADQAVACPSDSGLDGRGDRQRPVETTPAPEPQPSGGDRSPGEDRGSAPSQGCGLDGSASTADSPGSSHDGPLSEACRSADLASDTHLERAGMPVGGTSRTTEGLKVWLEQLRSASIACAVISNDDVAGIEHFLASHGLRDYFTAIWSAEHRPRKPDPQAVHGLCAELGIAAADCALIGDANSDLRMAVAAGIPHQLALGYTAAWSTPPPLAEPHPRVHHWNELSLA